MCSDCSKAVKMNFIKIWILLLCHLCHLSWQSMLFKSKLQLNPLSRGYEDITVVIDKNLKSEDCVRILKKIKVNIHILKFFLFGNGNTVKPSYSLYICAPFFTTLIGFKRSLLLTNS